MTDEPTFSYVNREDTPMGGVLQDYWFDMQLDGDAKTLVTYAWGGYLIDTRSDPTGEMSWSELVQAALPAVQADINQWGIIT
jgi:hypothetical protein